MKYKNLTSELKQVIYDTKGQALSDISKKYNVSVRALYKWKAKINLEFDNGIDNEALNDEEIVVDIISEDKRKIYRLEKELQQYKKAIKEAKTNIVSSDDVKHLIAGINNIGFKNEIPEWVDNDSKKLVPVVCLSDIHIGEVVEEGDVGFGDSYNTDLAHEYADKVINDFIGICKINMNYDYDGVVLILGGDILAGNNMHNMDDTNDRTAMQQVIEGGNLIIRAINNLHKNFGKVFVPAVTGNHDRLDGSRYTRTKQRTENSLGMMTYYYVQQHFADNDEVSIVTDKSDEVLFSINGHRFNLQHGDTIKGGNGIGGVAVPILRARAKKLTAAVAVNKAFDTLIIGHFHQSISLTGLIVMNSLKIYDEYSKMLGFSYSRPGSTSFFVNEFGEIIFSTDIIIRKEENIKYNKDKSISLF